ncbi:MAG: HTH domain-containing protein, partial [Phaeodactylibacter sp.]|nr:HTH domain-containing protein [Phaeodactylibacter sp.]
MAYTDNISRLSRLTAILLKLQSGSVASVHALAEQFEVSTRTIYRDLQALEQAGVPLTVNDGHGYQLLEGYTIPPVMFTEAEANALILAEKMIEKTEDASLIEAFQSATDKVRAVLKNSQKEKVKLLADRIIIGKNWNFSRT